ncbi:MAG: iron-containing alcohol dehydrogenase [Clostridia bacterium]
MNFNYFLPVNIVFGTGKVDEVATLVKPYGKKALIVTGGSSAKKSGLYDRVKKCLDDAGIGNVLFDKVQQNPLTTTMEEGVKVAKENNCDIVIAIGGGSVLDCGKAIGFMAVNDGDINDYIFNKIASDKALPIIAIPTTCGTGSEGNSFAVLTNPETNDKKSLRTPAIVPKISIIDPLCMRTMPKTVFASVGFDALCHCIEAYTSTIAHPISDALALHGITLLSENLVKLYENPDDISAWENVTIASTIGGMVINMAGVTLSHGMEHPASGIKDIVHGKGLSALTPVIIDASFEGSITKFEKISKLFGGTSAKDCGDRIRVLLDKLDLTCSLSELGIEEKDIPWMVENCFKVSAVSVANNPIVFDADGLHEIYKKAL